MIGMFKDLLSRRDHTADPGARIRLAAAALLVEAASLDGHLDESERIRILKLLRDRFGLGAEDAERLFAEAVAETERSVQLVGFTRTIKDAFDYDERVRLIEMLWEVAYADGHLHDYEANLVRRIAGLVYVADQDSGAARKRAMGRLNLGEGLV